MGQLMRRHWIPACLSEELADPDGAPVKVRLLAEELVAFRDSKGRVGIVDEFCPHRRASLLLGRNEECGLRCLYHGWKIDVDGNILEMPSEPQQSAFAQKIKHKAYPVREAGGFVWAYMGPFAEMPDFEQPAFAPTPDIKVSIVKIHVRCNWAQVLEGQIDFGAQLDLAFLRHAARPGGRRQGDRHRMAAAIDGPGTPAQIHGD